MKHTPTPWTTGEAEVSQATLVFDNADDALADCGQYQADRSHEECIINARFIVEACNAHYHLKREHKAIADHRDRLRKENKRLELERDTLREVANAVTAAYAIGALTGELAESTAELAEKGLAVLRSAQTDKNAVALAEGGKEATL